MSAGLPARRAAANSEGKNQSPSRVHPTPPGSGLTSGQGVYMKHLFVRSCGAREVLSCSALINGFRFMQQSAPAHSRCQEHDSPRRCRVEASTGAYPFGWAQPSDHGMALPRPGGEDGRPPAPWSDGVVRPGRLEPRITRPAAPNGSQSVSGPEQKKQP